MTPEELSDIERQYATASPLTVNGLMPRLIAEIRALWRADADKEEARLTAAQRQREGKIKARRERERAAAANAAIVPLDDTWSKPFVRKGER